MVFFLHQIVIVNSIKMPGSWVYLCAEEVVLGRAGGRWTWTQYGQVVGRWQYPTTIGHVVPNLWIQGAKKNTRAVYNIVQLPAFMGVHAIYVP